MERIIAHDGDAVREVAENAAAVLPGDHALPAGADRVAELRAVIGIRHDLFHGDRELVVPALVGFHDATEWLAGVVNVPQVCNRGIGQLPLCERDVVPIAGNKAATRPNCQHLAFQSGTGRVQIRLCPEKVASGKHRLAPGGDCETGLAIHVGDNEIDHRPRHIAQDV